MQAGWFEHPRYLMARERLILTLTSPHYRFRRSDPVIFLCGGLNSVPRDTLATYLRKNTPNLKLFYAEPIWEVLATKQKLGSLAMESDLARLADIIMIIVESPGTFAELGAFSHSDDLRPKLLAIVDSEYKPPQKSFLATGPIHWIDAESHFSPTIYTPLQSILTAAGEIQDRLSRIKASSTKVENLASDPKHLLLFLCDLVAIIYPATVEMVEAYYARIVSLASDPLIVPMSLALGKAMGILSSLEVDGTTYYYPKATDSGHKPYHHLYLATLPGLRSEHLTALQGIPRATKVLAEIWRHDAH